MKKNLLLIIAIVLGMLVLSACGSAEKNAEGVNPPVAEEAVEEVAAVVEVAPTVTEAVTAVEEAPKETANPVEDNKKEETAEDVSEAEADSETPEASKEDALELALKDVKEINPSRKMYATQDCNVRKGPSTDFDVVGHLKFNEEIEVVGQHKGGWYEFKTGDEVVFVSDKLLADTQIDMAAAQAALEALMAQTQTQSQANAAPAKTPATTQPAAGVPAAAPVKVTAPAGVLFIGDSRCVQMREALNGAGCSWICRNGARYEWFADTAIPQADTMVGKGTKVIICMGVNDPGDASKYAALANYKAAEWAARGAKTYYVSVNPVWENPYTSEEQVMAFNSSIVGQLMGIKWIDTHSYLQGAGYKLVDGLHYDGETYFKIFSAIMAGL